MCVCTLKTASNSFDKPEPPLHVPISASGAAAERKWTLCEEQRMQAPEGLTLSVDFQTLHSVTEGHCLFWDLGSADACP